MKKETKSNDEDLKLLESLDLGDTNIATDYKDDNFQGEIKNILSKINEEINHIKTPININSIIQPFDIDNEQTNNNNILNSKFGEKYITEHTLENNEPSINQEQQKKEKTSLNDSKNSNNALKNSENDKKTLQNNKNEESIELQNIQDIEINDSNIEKKENGQTENNAKHNEEKYQIDIQELDLDSSNKGEDIINNSKKEENNSIGKKEIEQQEKTKKEEEKINLEEKNSQNESKSFFDEEPKVIQEEKKSFTKNINNKSIDNQHENVNESHDDNINEIKIEIIGEEQNEEKQQPDVLKNKINDKKENEVDEHEQNEEKQPVNDLKNKIYDRKDNEADENINEINDNKKDNLEDNKDNDFNISEIKSLVTLPKDDNSKRDLANKLEKESVEKKILDNSKMYNEKGKNFRGGVESNVRINTMPDKKKQNPAIDGQIQKSHTQKVSSSMPIFIAIIKKTEESQIEVKSIDEYSIIGNFEQDEKSLGEIEKNFKEDILETDNKEEIVLREYYFAKNKIYFESLDEGKNISEYMSDIKPSHPNLMKDKLEKTNLKNLPKYEENFEKYIFQEPNYPNFTSYLGGVESFESFVQKYFLNSNIAMVESAKQSFLKWRRVQCDGNSFIRILIFSLFEAYILSNNIEEIKYLINEITDDELIDTYKEYSIDYETGFKILAIILYNIEKNNKEYAYNILIKSYSLKDTCFDKMLIVYVRYLLVFYIEEIIKIIEEIKNKEKNYVIKKLNHYKNRTKSLNIELSFFNICLLQYIFNANMKIFNMNGDFVKPGQREISFSDPEKKEIPQITFGFFYSSYFKLYPKDFESLNNFQLELMENNNKQLTYVYKDPKACLKCSKETIHILFLEKNCVICKNCLEEHLSYCCNFRADAFKEDGFIGLEYYSRSVHIKDNLYINDFEIIELLETFNIITAIIQKYDDKYCDYCHKSKGKIIVFNCGCTFCQKCITEIILKMGSYKVLNPFEKFQLEDGKCVCQKNFDLETALKNTKHDKDDEKKAYLRLKNYVNMFCMGCTTQLRTEEDNKYQDINDDVKYKRVKLKRILKDEESQYEFTETEHIICENCYNKYIKGNAIKQDKDTDMDDEEEQEKGDDIYNKNKKNEKKGENNMNNSKIDSDNRFINCSICFRKHQLDQKLLADGGCCTGCYIF